MIKTFKGLRGTATLYLGDCLAILPTLEGVDVTVTDPPYDAKTHKGAFTDSTAEYISGASKAGVEFSAIENPAQIARALIEISKRWVICFCAVEQIGAYADGVGDCWVRAGIWDKIAPSPQITGDRPGQAVEGIAIMHRKGRKKWNRGGGAGIWRAMPPKGDDRPDHPTPKPEKLMGMLVNDFTEENETVLDPFMGSGTTGIACLRTGRNFIGIEIDPKHYATACERMAREVDGELL